MRWASVLGISNRNESNGNARAGGMPLRTVQSARSALTHKSLAELISRKREAAASAAATFPPMTLSVFQPRQRRNGSGLMSSRRGSVRGQNTREVSTFHVFNQGGERKEEEEEEGG